MPISRSAKKSLRVTRRHAAVNQARKRLVKVALKKADAKNLPKAISLVDKAAKWGLYHPNKTARLKSRLMAKFNQPIKPEKPTKKPRTKKS